MRLLLVLYVGKPWRERAVVSVQNVNYRAPEVTFGEHSLPYMPRGGKT